MTTQQPAALWIAYELEIGTFVPNVLQNEIVLRQNAAAELLRQHAHITELESQLAQRFDAADMATAAAQGFRDGAAKEQQAGAFQAALDIRTAQGWKLAGDKAPVLYTDEINGQQVCRDDVWLCTTDAFTHHSPSEGMAGWTTLPGQMPEPNTPVLLDIGKKFTIRALWAEKHTVRVGTDVDDWGEYDEETDEYYCPEGWYEWNEHEEVHWAVSETPRAWRELPQPLPAAPGPADGESK